MRPLEIAILILDLAALLALCLPFRSARRWGRFLPAGVVAITLVHLVVEHYRWQMAPAYGLAAVQALFTLPALLKPAALSAPARGVRVLAAGGAGLLCWLVAAALPVILPVPRLPLPPGPYAVGTVVYDWTDAARAEPYSVDPNVKRELMVQIWYPAEPAADARPALYLDHPDAALPAFAQFLKLPAFTLEHLRLVQTHSVEAAPLLSDGAPYPVVIYSHGFQSYRTASFNQMEALASAGYIAVAIDHPYAAMFTAFPDGRVISGFPSVLPPSTQNQAVDQAAREKLQAMVAADERFVIDQLQLLNAGKPDARFAGKLDLQRIGLTGVSLGGGAIVRACHVDARCKAGLVQDGWFEPLPAAMVSEPLRQPYMFMQSDTRMWKLDNLARLDMLYKGVSAPAFHLRLAGVLHDDFGDYPLLTPLGALLPERGTLNGERTLQVVDAYLLAFFDTYLKNQPSPLLSGASRDYPEVRFASR